MKITTSRIVPHFSTTAEMLPLIEDEEVMVSFGFTSLQTNIPIIDTFYIIKNYLNNDDQFTTNTSIPQNKFFDLVNLILTTSWYTFNL